MTIANIKIMRFPFCHRRPRAGVQFHKFPSITLTLLFFFFSQLNASAARQLYFARRRAFNGTLINSGIDDVKMRYLIFIT